MNLNFIQDNDQIHVETQNQITYRQEIILKAKLLKEDFYDYSQVHPPLIQISHLFTQIVKDLYEHAFNMIQKDIQVPEGKIQLSQLKEHNLQAPKRKKTSIPYGTMKKLEVLKQKFITCNKIINQLNYTYRKSNLNSQNEKRSESKFYKQILNSYQNQRQYFKKFTLQLEDRVQQVETQVKKLSKNENNSFTDFESQVISIEQIDSIFKYEKKMTALKNVINEMNLLRKTRQNISNALKSQQQRKGETKRKIKDETIVYARNYMKSVASVEKKINIAKINKTQILQSKLLLQKNEIAKLKVKNERLKKGILQHEGVKYFIELQKKIVNSRANKQIRNKEDTKITRTDYTIYLKELNNQISQYFKSKQVVYRFKTPNLNRSNEVMSKSVIFSKS